MATRDSRATATAPSATLLALAPSFRRSLEAANKSPKTVKSYMDAVRLLADYLAGVGMPLAVAHVKREHVESFILDLLVRHKPATASNRFRALQQFFKWAIDEGEAKSSPMDRMKPPAVPVEAPPVLTEAQLSRLFKTCEGPDFDDRRDMAILRLFADSGMHRSELAYLTITNVDLDLNVAYVVGKGRRERACPFGKRTALALDRYLRVRGAHPNADAPALWLGWGGHTGPMTDSGVAQVVERRALQAGLGKIHPHQFRHSFAHSWLSNGGQETDLMMLAGWRSRTMVSRYGASAAAERAREAHRRLALGDRV